MGIEPATRCTTASCPTTTWTVQSISILNIYLVTHRFLINELDILLFEIIDRLSEVAAVFI